MSVAVHFIELRPARLHNTSVFSTRMRSSFSALPSPRALDLQDGPELGDEASLLGIAMSGAVVEGRARRFERRLKLTALVKVGSVIQADLTRGPEAGLLAVA